MDGPMVPFGAAIPIGRAIRGQAITRLAGQGLLECLRVSREHFRLRPQVRSRVRSSLLLRTQERPRKTINNTAPMPEATSLMAFSETWPKA